jgi:hypothetical protein
MLRPPQPQRQLSEPSHMNRLFISIFPALEPTGLTIHFAPVFRKHVPLDTKTRSSSATVDKRSKMAIPQPPRFDTTHAAVYFGSEAPLATRVQKAPSPLTPNYGNMLSRDNLSREQMDEQLFQQYQLLTMQSDALRAQLAAQQHAQQAYQLRAAQMHTHAMGKAQAYDRIPSSTERPQPSHQERPWEDTSSSIIQDPTDVQAYTWHGAPNNEYETSRLPEDTLTSFNPIPLNVEHERMANMPTVSVSRVTESRPWFSRNLIPDVKTVLRSEPVAAEETSTLPNGISLSPSWLNHASGNSVRRQLEVPGWLRMSHVQDDLAGACIPATPDSGFSFDIIAESVALQFDIPVDSSTAQTLRLPNRATTRSWALSHCIGNSATNRSVINAFFKF